jgi:tRNA dimethylallyltransferase
LAASSVAVICGPTAAGKSAIAMRLAEAHGALIVSADSRQVYKGFDVGTAKPTPEERARVPHRGLDVVEPTVRYSAASWADDADQWLREAAGEGRPALVVGGTGFYLRALFAPLFDAPPADASRRLALERELGAFSTETLRRWCERLDPARAHLGRTQLLRAVETALLHGERLSEMHARRARPARRVARYLVVDPGPGLGERIRVRVVAMLRGGWPEEVAALAARVPADAPAWNASGYGVVRRLVAGALTHDTAVEQITIETRQYAKRQRTWFRHQLPEAGVVRVNPDDPGCAAAVTEWWERGGGT